MTDKAAIPDAWRPSGKPRGTRDPELNLDARAQAFLDRIAPLSADLAAHGHTRALALKKLRRICQAEVRGLKERLTPATVKLYLFKYRERRKDRRKKWQQGYYRTNREKNRGLCCWVHKQQIAERRRRKYFADRAALFGKAKSNHDQAPFHLSWRTTRRSRRAPSRV